MGPGEASSGTGAVERARTHTTGGAVPTHVSRHHHYPGYHTVQQPPATRVHHVCTASQRLSEVHQAPLRYSQYLNRPAPAYTETFRSIINKSGLLEISEIKPCLCRTFSGIKKWRKVNKSRFITVLVKKEQ